MASKEVKEKTAKAVTDYVVDYLKREKPWVLLIDQEIGEFIKKRKSGTINFSVRIFKGKGQDMVVEVLPFSKSVKFIFKKK